MKHYVCIHGHFYQPPRENPWLEGIELQDSAFPFHDWNERINAECYAPNAHARILDDQDLITNIVNNYARMSFNFGPTLLSWIEQKSPDTYQRILDADRESAERFDGHGSAIAQVYNHVIMPLASERDRRTQVRWGVRDFAHRFGRKPVGLWLSETAVNTASLEALAAEGIEFTILAPHQCRRVRRCNAEGKPTESWRPPGTDHLREACFARLPSGRRISLFFYDGEISQSVAFERLLGNGGAFASRLCGAFTNGHDGAQIVHIATDGETYGHHHHFGEMALAYALRHIEKNTRARITNYSQFLAIQPPTLEVEILDNSSWSCAHGIERWRSDCGCKIDTGRSWNQAWRRPLREALDWLSIRLATAFESSNLLHDPWAARDEYIDVILDRGRANVDEFLSRHLMGAATHVRVVEALQQLEAQRHAMLMFTSCGWFFDEVSGLENLQILRYAARSIQLTASRIPGVEEDFIERLRGAISNIPEQKDAAHIYLTRCRAASVDLPKVVAHYAVSSLFEDYGTQEAVYGFDVDRMDYKSSRSGGRKIAIGQVRCTSRITREEETLSFATLHLGDHNVSGGVRAFRGTELYEEMSGSVLNAFNEGNIPEVVRLLDKYFLEMTYSLRSLFRDEQRRIIGLVVDTALEDAIEMSIKLRDRHGALIRYAVALDYPLPSTVRSAADFVLNANLQQELDAEKPNRDRVTALLAEARALKVKLDDETLSRTVRARLERNVERWLSDPSSAERLRDLADSARLIQTLPFKVYVFHAQNLLLPQIKEWGASSFAASDDAGHASAESIELVRAICAALGMRGP